jgi:hypothetical protein
VSDRAAQVKRRGAAIIKIVEAIGEDPQDEGVFKLVECGLHSGFPQCCIEFFVKTYWPIMTVTSSMNAHGETLEELFDRASLQQATALRAMERYRTTVFKSRVIEPGYVPCPHCLSRGRFVKVKRCDWHLTARERRRIIARANRQT